MEAGSPGDYIRPQGCHPGLQPITTRSTQARLIQIKNDSPITQLVDVDQFYWLYDADEFAELDLDLVDVLPRFSWHQDRAMIVSTRPPPNCHSLPILVRSAIVRVHPPIFLWCSHWQHEAFSMRPNATLWYAPKIRSQDSGELVRVRFLAPQIASKTSASNGFVNLHIGLESDARQPIITIKPEMLPHPPNHIIDAIRDLELLELIIGVSQKLEEEKDRISEIADIKKKVQEKTNQLTAIGRARERVDDDLKRLEEKKRAIIEAEIIAFQEVRDLTAREKYVEEKQGPSATQFVEMKLRELFKKDANATYWTPHTMSMLPVPSDDRRIEEATSFVTAAMERLESENSEQESPFT